jgi:hypothetical protein
MDELEKIFRENNGTLSYEEILEMLEAELEEEELNQYKPLNFDDED